MGISVLISVYGGANAEHLGVALESIAAQTLPADEVVLMEDGPLGTAHRDVIDAYADERTLVIALEPGDDRPSIEGKRAAAAASAGCGGDAGSAPRLVIGRFSENVQLGRALAAGVILCSCPLIARMDADDVALPERLATEAAFLREHPEVSVLGGAIEEFDGDVVKGTKTIPGGEALRAYAKFRCPVNHMTVMMRREAILGAGNYRHFPGLEDYELWSRVLAAGYVLDNVPDVLVRARCDSGFYDRRGGDDYGHRYLELRRMQREWGLLSRREHLKACAATAAMVYAPRSLRKLFYKILRRKG